METKKETSLSVRYPKYFKDVSDITELDVYGVHQLFGIQDPSGALQHASKKLLLSGVRTGGKSKFQDIKEARDTLTRWLELNSQEEGYVVPDLNGPIHPVMGTTTIVPAVWRKPSSPEKV